MPTQEQLVRLVEAMKADLMWPLWRVMISTGLRPGECLALRWEDVDLEVGQIRVQRALSWLGKGAWEIHPPKTERSRRTVVAPAQTMAVIRQHRRSQQEQRLAAGPAYESHGFVFANATGGPLRWRSVRRTHWRRIVAASGLAHLRLRPYDLRHLHATLLLCEGVSIRTISDRLGHHDPAFTLATYTHTMPGAQEAAAAAIEQALSRSTQPRV